MKRLSSDLYHRCRRALLRCDELDENAALGFYSIQIQFGEDQYFYGEFQVAAYRKPEFLVEAATDKPEYVHGDKIRVSAAAEFFSGGPVSNAEVRWTLLSDDYFFRYQGEGFYDFTDYDFSRRNFDNYFPGFGESIEIGRPPIRRSKYHRQSINRNWHFKRRKFDCMLSFAK